jgi:hypothetical protein
MIRLPQIKVRTDRLRNLARSLGQEATAQKNDDRLLAPLERHRYVVCMTNDMAKLEKARVVLMNVVKRLEKGGG